MHPQFTPEQIERFWSKVDKTGDCWLWTGAGDRYGVTQRGIGRRRRLESAHRVAWELAHGEIPVGLFVCHTCDNQRCVRAEHLFLGTPADNVRDMVAKGRRGAIHNSVRGERHGMAKLTASAVVDIRSSRQSHPKLAARYGVTVSLIEKVVARQVWAHI